MKTKHIGFNYLHRHPSLEQRADLDPLHVIVDIEDWKEVVDYFQYYPNELKKLGYLNHTILEGEAVDFSEKLIITNDTVSMEDFVFDVEIETPKSPISDDIFRWDIPLFEPEPLPEISGCNCFHCEMARIINNSNK